MYKRVLFWLGNSRLFSLPMTIMSWLVVFIYALKDGGNILNGILALIGIAFAHLATNLFDDYVDYRTLSKETAFKENNEKSKCSYIKEGKATLNELLKVVIIYCSIAFIIGIILTFRSGLGVVLLALIGGCIVLTYAKLSSNGFSELAVGTAFGPLLFEGTYYVMCKKFSPEVFILSIAVVVFTVGLVYMNNVLDYEKDIECGKKSLCCRLGDTNLIATGLVVLYSVGYLMCFVLMFWFKNIFYCLPLITVILVYQLYNSVKTFYADKNNIPEIKWWNFPMGNKTNIIKSGTTPFYFRLYFARNIMIWFSAFIIFAIFMQNSQA